MHSSHQQKQNTFYVKTEVHMVHVHCVYHLQLNRMLYISIHTYNLEIKMDSLKKQYHGYMISIQILLHNEYSHVYIYIVSNTSAELSLPLENSCELL